jgi:primosomal protein N' (replication factor Y)
VARVLVADVAFSARAGGGDAQFSYLAPFDVRPGDLVLAPLSNRPLVGAVLAQREVTELELGFSLSKLKALEGRIEGVRLPPELMETALFVAKNYLSPVSAAIGLALPPGIGDRLASSWTLADAAPRMEGLTPLQQELLLAAAAAGGRLSPPKSAPAPTLRALRLLEAKGLLRRETRLEPFEIAARQELFRLTPDESRVENFLRDFAKKRPAQALTLLKLREGDRGALSLEDVRSLGGVTLAAAKALADAGLLEPVAASSKGVPSAAPDPNAAQTAAIRAIHDAIGAKVSKGFLLFGVTGSGKTEVYLRAAAEALRRGRQVLYLVPEIALATQAIGQLRDRFGESVAVLHSELTPKDRLGHWMQIAAGKAPVVIGARSALFAPLGNLGLILMDEEHEGGYKQESSPRYHSKAVVQRLAQAHGCPYVLGSATPSIESFSAASEGELELLELPNRAASAQLPDVEIEDLAFGYRSGRPALLSGRLEELLAEAVAEKRQAILFLNRRAYAPFLVCRECGHFFMCPRCAVTLTFSRKAGLLRCHHCGHQEPPPDSCPSCRGTRLSPVGVGTEKVEEAVRALLPEARVARLDRDVAQRRGALEAILAAFGAGELDVLVGTQIVAKGLNFPNVTLVGVVAADVSLNLPDFRASERTFQLLSQVSGRAGRGDVPGKVVIQTFNPSHVAIQTARVHDYRAFYEASIEERFAAGYPPFRRLVNLVLSGSDYAPVLQAGERLARNLRSALPHSEVLGPAPCVIERIQNRWRRHILLKVPPEAELTALGESVASFEDSKVQITIDVDPYSLM